MNPGLLLLLVCGAAFSTICVTVIINLDRVIVAGMRAFGIHIFPTAIEIAVSIETHPDKWKSDGYRLELAGFGSVWIANEAYGLTVETPTTGKWKPSWIERRIIRNAVDWHTGHYLRNRVHAAIVGHAT